jgi:hypothetical protein
MYYLKLENIINNKIYEIMCIDQMHTIEYLQHALVSAFFRSVKSHHVDIILNGKILPPYTLFEDHNIKTDTLLKFNCRMHTGFILK